MKPQQLVIGGWYDVPPIMHGRLVAVDGNQVKILADDETYSLMIGSISQIPITPEILSKIGLEQKCRTIFRLLDDYFDLTINEVNDGLWRICYHNCEVSLPDQQQLISYVDELQRFFTDCGIEKDIEL